MPRLCEGNPAAHLKGSAGGAEDRGNSLGRQALADTSFALPTYPPNTTGQVWGRILLLPCWSQRSSLLEHSAAPRLGMASARAGSFSSPQPEASKHAQRRHSLTAFLKPVGAHSHNSQPLPSRNLWACPTPSICLVKASSQVQSPEEILLDLLVPVAKGAVVPEHHGNITFQKDSSCQATTPGHWIDSRLKHNPSLPLKRPIYLVWSFNLRDRLQVFHMSRG